MSYSYSYASDPRHYCQDVNISRGQDGTKRSHELELDEEVDELELALLAVLELDELDRAGANIEAQQERFPSHERSSSRETQ